MSKTDLVLLHAPSVYDFREQSIMYGPVSDMVPSTPVFEMYPLGFTTMADYLERRGFKVRIVNLAVLMLNRANFDVEAAIRDMNPAAFGIDLHWLPHAHGALAVAEMVKRHHPDTPVIFGGFSAAELKELAMTGREQALAAGEMLFTEGARADQFYFLAEGEMETLLKTDEEDISLSSIPPGEPVGWSALIEPHIYTASARATRPKPEKVLSPSAARARRA